MSKAAFKQEIDDYKKNGGKFSFRFDDIVLPEIYREAVGTIGARMPAHEIFVPVDYNIGLDYNLDALLNKLLEKYPEITD